MDQVVRHGLECSTSDNHDDAAASNGLTGTNVRDLLVAFLC